MKDILINNPNIGRDAQFAKRLDFLLRGKFKKSALWIKGVESFSNISYNVAGRPVNSKQHNLLQAFTQYSIFLADYVNLVLFNNELAEQRKSGPYDIFFHLTVDVEEYKAKVHIYLDSDIFGLIAGSKYINLINIIRASFPIFSKIGFEVELKLFSIQENSNRQKYSTKHYSRPEKQHKPLPVEEEYSSFDEDFPPEEGEEDSFVYETEDE